MESHGKLLFLVTLSLTALSLLTVLVRGYTRKREGQFKLDDWLTTAAFIFTLACSISILLGVKYGFGRHIRDIPDLDDGAHAIKYVLIAPYFAAASSFLVKWSIIEGYRRILARNISIQLKIATYLLLLLLLMGSGLACAAMVIFCRPIRTTSSPDLQSSCARPHVLNWMWLVSAYNAFMDVYLILIALRYYGTLQMPLKNRVRVCCQTVIGSAVDIITSMVKIWLMCGIFEAADITHAWWPVTTCYLIENHVYIILTSGFAFRNLLPKPRNSFQSSPRHNGASQSSILSTRRPSIDISLAYGSGPEQSRGDLQVTRKHSHGTDITMVSTAARSMNCAQESTDFV